MLPAVAATAASASAATWGEGSVAKLTVGSSSGQVDEVQPGAVRFAAAPDGSYFLVEPGPTTGGGTAQYRLQHFNGTTLEGGTSFSGTQEVTERAVTGEPVETLDSSGPVSIAVTSTRVYVLESFTRREADEAEAKVEKFPLDDAQPAAGALYGFEYSGTEVKALNGGKPLIGAEELAFQGEAPGEAILNPRGIAVDPRNGDVVIAASEDIVKVNKATGSEKKCRPIAQYLVPSGSTATLGHRFADTTQTMAGELAGLGCGEELEAEAYDQTPLSPVVTAGGRLLVYFDDEAAGIPAQIWEMVAPSETEENTKSTTEVKPHELWGGTLGEEPRYPAETFVEPGEEVGIGALSAVTEGSKEGSLYVDANHTLASGAGVGAPIVLHYLEPAKANEQVHLSEDGWTAGAETVPNHVAPPCGLWDESSQVADVAGLPGHKYLAFSQYKLGSAEAVEVKGFGEGASAAGCPTEPTLNPVVNTSQGNNVHVVPAGSPATLEDVIGAPLSGTSVVELGRARGVEWIIKYRLAGGAEGEEKIPVSDSSEAEWGATVQLKHTFAKPGTYQVTAAITTTDLGHSLAAIAPADEVKVEGQSLNVQMQTPSPREVTAKSGEVKLKATIEAPAGEKLLVTGVDWTFGEGARHEEDLESKPLGIEGNGSVETSHVYNSSCSSGTCKVTVAIEGYTEKGGVKTFYSGSSEKTVVVHEPAPPPPCETCGETGTTTTPTTTTPTTTTATEPPKQEVEAYEAHASGGSLKVAPNGSFTVKISCPTGACSGTLAVTATLATTARKHGKTVHKALKVTIASGTFSLAGGQSKLITLRLSSKARAILAHSHKLSARLTITSRSHTGQTSSSSVGLALKLAAKKHK
jgi:hypothetical protein